MQYTCLIQSYTDKYSCTGEVEQNFTNGQLGYRKLKHGIIMRD